MRNHVRRADTEALVAGETLTDDHAAGLDDVEQLFTAMRNDYGALPAPEPRPVLASILDGRRPLRTVAEPAAVAAAPRASLLGWHRWPRPVAAALATGTLLFSGLAVAGALPAPVQRVSADVGAAMGFDLPRPADAPPATTPVTPRTAPTHAGHSNSTDAPRSGAGRTGSDDGRGTSPLTTPSLTDPLPGATGALPTIPTTPALHLPVPSPPSTSHLLPPFNPLAGVTGPLGPLGATGGDLLPDLPPVVHSP